MKQWLFLLWLFENLNLVFNQCTGVSVVGFWFKIIFFQSLIKELTTKSHIISILLNSCRNDLLFANNFPGIQIKLIMYGDLMNFLVQPNFRWTRSCYINSYLPPVGKVPSIGHCIWYIIKIVFIYHQFIFHYYQLYVSWKVIKLL